MKTLKYLLILFLISTNLYSNILSDLSDLNTESKINTLVKKENKIFYHYKKYILTTGDLNPTVTKIINRFSLTTEDFTNISGNNINRNIYSNNITLTNVNDGLSGKYLNSYINNSYRDIKSYINRNNQVSQNLEINESNYIRLIKNIELNSINTIISESVPRFTKDYWYKPDGLGNIEVFKDVSNVWTNLGTIYSEESVNKNCVGIFQDLRLLNEIKVFDNSCRKIKREEYINTYRFIEEENKWFPEGVIAQNTSISFNGMRSVLELRTIYKDYDGNSKSLTIRNNGEYRGYKSYQKYTSINGEGFWIRATNDYRVRDDITDLREAKQFNNTIRNAWIRKPDESDVYYMRLVNVSGTDYWAYEVDNYEDLRLIEGRIDNIYGYVKTPTLNAQNVFQYNSNVWKSMTNDIEIRSLNNGREIFTSNISNIPYLNYSNDCNVTNCNGIPSNNYYRGNKEGNMNVFYYSTSGKRKNNLIDRIPRRNLYECYDNNDQRCLVSGNVYVQETDINGNMVFKRTSNNQFYMGNGVQLPSSYVTGGKRNIPTTKRMRDITLTSGIINLSNRTERRNWILRTNGMRSYILGNSYTFSTNGNGRSNYYYWGKSNERFTRGSRKNLANRSSSIISYLTKMLCNPNRTCSKTNGTENRYTTNGLTSSIDSSFKKWYYSTSGTRTKNMLDSISRRNLYECYDNRDTNCLISGNIYVQETDVNGNMVFKRSDNNQFYMGSGVQLPSSYVTSGKRNIPPTKIMRDVTLTSGMINLSNRTERRNWLLRTNSMRAYILGNSYTFSTNGNGRSNYYYWGKSNERFTRGSRTNFPNRSSSIISYLTKMLCNPNRTCSKTNGAENRYTTNGLTSSIDSSFKKWYYSTSGTRTKNMLDRYPCTTDNDCYSKRDSYPKLIQNTRTLNKNGKFLRYDDNGVYLVKTWKANVYTSCKNSSTTIYGSINYKGSGSSWQRCQYVTGWINGTVSKKPYRVYTRHNVPSFISIPIKCSSLSSSVWGWDNHNCHRDPSLTRSWSSSVCVM